ncbi:MAG: site-specific DNA-methyltransferase [Candidatus Woesearchaeota archaeon]
MEINKIYQGDCLELMKEIKDEDIDLILTDTPYGINFKSNMDTKNRFDYIQNDDNLDFFEPFIKQAYRVLKNNTCLFLFCRFDNYPYFFEIVTKNGFKVKNCLIWEKNKTLGGLGDIESSFLNNYEFIIFAMKGRKILFKDGIGREFGLIKDDTISNPSQLLYPTQKPLKILRKLIKISTKEGDIVLDAFCGSGSTCVASKETNRKYIGIDINPKAVNIANKRLSQEVLKL